MRLDGSQQPLGLLHRLRAVLAQAQCHGAPLAQQLIGMAEPVHHVEPTGGDGIEGFCAQHVSAGLARAHGAHHIGADHRRHQSQGHLGEAEAGIFAGQHDVAGADKA